MTNLAQRMIGKGGLLLTRVIVGGVALAAGGREHEDEIEAVAARLRALPGVRLVSIGGQQDFKIRNIQATLEIEGKGTLRLYGVNGSSFSRPETLQVVQAGDYVPTVVGYGYFGVVDTATGAPLRTISLGDSLHLEAGSPFVALFHRRYATVQDVVMHFDEIRAILRAWPVCPRALTLARDDGSQYRYCANRAGDKQVSPDYPSQWLPNGPPRSPVE